MRDKGEVRDGMPQELKPNKQRWETLSKELKVAVTIQALNDLKDPLEIPHFSNIGKHLSKFDDMSKTTINTALDRLIDLGTIDSEWIKVDSKYVRMFKLKGENQEFVRRLSRELYK